MKQFIKAYFQRNDKNYQIRLMSLIEYKRRYKLINKESSTRTVDFPLEKPDDEFSLLLSYNNTSIEIIVSSSQYSIMKIYSKLKKLIKIRSGLSYNYNGIEIQYLDESLYFNTLSIDFHDISQYLNNNFLLFLSGYRIITTSFPYDGIEFSKSFKRSFYIVIKKSSIYFFKESRLLFPVVFLNFLEEECLVYRIIEFELLIMSEYDINAQFGMLYICGKINSIILKYTTIILNEKGIDQNPIFLFEIKRFPDNESSINILYNYFNNLREKEFKLISNIKNVFIFFESNIVVHNFILNEERIDILNVYQIETYDYSQILIEGNILICLSNDKLVLFEFVNIFSEAMMTQRIITWENQIKIRLFINRAKFGRVYLKVSDLKNKTMQYISIEELVVKFDKFTKNIYNRLILLVIDFLLVLCGLIGFLFIIFYHFDVEKLNKLSIIIGVLN